MCESCKVEAAEFSGSKQFAGLSYCAGCWAAWFESAAQRRAAAGVAGPQSIGCYPWYAPKTSANSPLQGQHLQFIEIGTSTWGTLSQYCASDYKAASSFGARIWHYGQDLLWARGLAVEAVQEHLEALPSLPYVTKVAAAIDEFSGKDILYCVSGENAKLYLGEYSAPLPNNADEPVEVDVMWYAMSMSSLGRPQPELERMLQSCGRLDLLERRSVSVLSWGSLCTQYKVASVDVLQLDCEGKDCAILRGMLSHCESQPAIFPRLIQFEANSLTDPEDLQTTLEALMTRGGYRVLERRERDILIERSWSISD